MIDMENLTMQETCKLCDKKQETNDIFHVYEDLGFSLCDACDSLGPVEVNKRWRAKHDVNVLLDESGGKK